MLNILYFYDVAPYAGAWIETYAYTVDMARNEVAPYAGAWIETAFSTAQPRPVACRSLRGSVD